MNKRIPGPLGPMIKLLPICPDHPEARIRYSRDHAHFELNGYPAGRGMDSNHHYECAICGRELEPPEKKGESDE